MSKIVFQINYDIRPETRENYLSTIKELQQHITNSSSKTYMVMEDKNKKNNFTEMYICNSEEEYENLEANVDDKTFELTNRLFTDFIQDKKVNYSTYYEID
jgi:predicted ferric reductase